MRSFVTVPGFLAAVAGPNSTTFPAPAATTVSVTDLA